MKTRDFFKKALSSMLLFGFANRIAYAAHSYKPSSMKETSKPEFVHHVFFWAKQGITDAERFKFIEALYDLVKIKSVIRFSIGEPADTNRPVVDRSYTYSLLTIFEDKKGHDLYQEHPIHKKFITDCQSLWSKVVVYDSVTVYGISD